MIEREPAICPVCQKAFQAQTALNDINPTAIQTAVTNFSNAINDLTDKTVKNLEAIQPNVEESVVFRGQTYGPDVTTVCDNIKSLKNDISSILDSADLYQIAVNKYNQLQQEYNEIAQRQAESCAAQDRAAAQATSTTETDPAAGGVDG